MTATTLPGAGTLAALIAVALLVVGLLVVLMRRHTQALPLLAIAALPFRLPISAGGKTVNLLIPLYLVVAAGTIAFLIPRLMAAVAARRDAAAQDGPAGASMRRLAWWTSTSGLQALLFGAIGLYALQAIYSADHARAGENILAFYIPFALLFLLLRDVSWDRELLLRCLGVAAALAVIFAGIGFVEYSRKSLFLNPKVVAANQYDNYFRVNSLFFDPNIYGRFLALVMIAVMTVVLWTRRRRDMYAGAAVLAWLLAGLVTSFSQSSIAALLLGLAVLAAFRWDVRRTAQVSVVLLALALAGVLLSPASLHFGLKGSSGSTSNATSGRTKLISGGLELFSARPLQGYGSGSFETEYKRHSGASAENATSASHTIPVTVAAEQGVLGLALYIALLISRCDGAVPRRRAARRRASPSPPAFAALVLHTWTYADFLEDPFTWAILAIGVALAKDAQAEQASSF